MVAVQIVRVEDTVEVVAFMLEDHGGEAFDAFCRVAQGFKRGVVDVDVLIPLDIAAFPRNAETSFRSKGFFASETSDPDVWIDLERLAVLIEPLNGHDTA